MKRTLASVCLALALTSVAPASADVIVGSVEASAAHPAIPRMLYNASVKLNGYLGFVATLDPSANERSFTLRRMDGATGREDLDVWFYRDIAGTGDPCPRVIDGEEAGGESGSVCAGARYAVVVLFAGLDANFQLQVG